MYLVLGLLMPFLGTTLGAAMVFFMKDKMNYKVQKILLGFASGVMIAASVWSLLIPAIDMASEQKARTVYENLIKMTSDQDVINVLLFLRQREIVHYNRFKDLLDVYTKEDNMVK